jgi:glycosyltransferase involved in cell wall biosynthesis
VELLLSRVRVFESSVSVDAAPCAAMDRSEPLEGVESTCAPKPDRPMVSVRVLNCNHADYLPTALDELRGETEHLRDHLSGRCVDGCELGGIAGLPQPVSGNRGQRFDPNPPSERRMKSETIRLAPSEQSRPTVPTLSVCMTNYNHARFLPTALDGLLGQADFVTELLVLDDASSDESWEVLEDYASRFDKLRIFRNSRNRGVIANINHLLELSTGEYWYGAAADDLVLPGFFEKSLECLAQHPQAGLCSTLTRVSDEGGRDRGIFFRSPFGRLSPIYLPPSTVRQELLERGSWIVGCTTIYRRNVLIEAGGFRTELGPFCDGFVQKVLALRHGACFIAEPLTSWRRIDNSYSATVANDVRESQKVYEAARSLMVGDFSDIFSERYIARWQRRWKSDRISRFSKQGKKESRESLNLILEGEGMVDAVLRHILGGGISLSYSAVRLIGGLVLRGGDVTGWLKRRVRR